MDSYENDKINQLTEVVIPETSNNQVVVKSRACQQCCSKENLKEQALLIATIVAVFLGIIVGISLRTIKCPTGTENKNRSVLV